MKELQDFIACLKKNSLTLYILYLKGCQLMLNFQSNAIV